MEDFVADPKIRAVIVDDEESGRIMLRYALSKQANWSISGEFNHASAAREFLCKHSVDVVFLDIQMPQENGLTLARSICNMQHPPLIIFVTAYNAHAIDAFEVHALDYLLKPFNALRFNQALERASEMLAQRRGYTQVLQGFVDSMENSEAKSKSPPHPIIHAIPSRDQIHSQSLSQSDVPPAKNYLKHIIVRSVGEMESIAVADILWIASASNYVELHLNKRVVLHRMPLNTLEKLLNPAEFMRVHRGNIVRLDQFQQIKVVGDGTFCLRLYNQDEVPVSERYIGQVRSYFLK